MQKITSMIDKKAVQLINDLKASVEKNGVNAETAVDQLKELREIIKQHNDPMVVKSIRLVYEFMEEKGTFSISFLEDADESANFNYFLDLIANSDNPYNREELGELNTFLKEQNA